MHWFFCLSECDQSGPGLEPPVFGLVAPVGPGPAELKTATVVAVAIKHKAKDDFSLH